MKPEVEKLNPAQVYVKNCRMRFASLFPSDMALFVKMLHTYGQDLFWKDGELVDSERAAITDREKNQLTEEGWDSFKNNDRLLYNWQAPSSSTALLEIPDNAAQHWLEFLSHLAFQVKKFHAPDMQAYIEAHYMLQSMGIEYKRSYAAQSWEAFQKVQKACEYIWERVKYIQQNNWQKKHPRPLEVKKGATVRLKTGFETAIVEVDDLTFGNHRVKGACYLSVPLGGTKYWNKDDLIAVDPKQKS